MDPTIGSLQGLMPVSPPSIFKGDNFENYSIKLKAYMGIYDPKARDYFQRVEANLETPVTDRDIYKYEIVPYADGTLVERKTATDVTTTAVYLQNILLMTCEGPHYQWLAATKLSMATRAGESCAYVTK